METSLRRSRTGSVVVCVAPGPVRGSLRHGPLTVAVGWATCLSGVGPSPLPSHPIPPPIPAALQPGFLSKVREVVAQQAPDHFIKQMGPTFGAHLSLRSRTVTAYDIDVCRLFHGLVEADSHNMTGPGLSSVAHVYGAVLRRYAGPGYNRSRTVWHWLHAGKASVDSRVRMVTQVHPQSPR